jgi:hypothetical protein
VDSALSAALAQLDSLRARIVDLAAREADLQGRFVDWTLATCANPSVTAAAINASMWCHGCAGAAYVTGLIPRVEAVYDLYARL